MIGLNTRSYAAKQEPTELACSFQSGCTLTGVYTPALNTDEPDTGALNKEAQAPCALYITAGLLHHVGPTRLHVELARTLSGQGVAGFRFDLSGAGDSETGSLGGYFMDRSVTEIKDAMAYLQTEIGHQHFVLVGLCSGADDALATAQQDERVSGLVLLNSYAYQAGWFRVHRVIKFYLPRLLVWSKVVNGVKRLLNKTNNTKKNEQAALAQLDDDFRYIPPREETESALASLCQVKTDMLFVYTGSEHEEYTYQGQLFAMFPSLKGESTVVEKYLPAADHTLILQQDRHVVITWVSEWFKRAKFERVSSTAKSKR